MAARRSKHDDDQIIIKLPDVPVDEQDDESRGQSVLRRPSLPRAGSATVSSSAQQHAVSSHRRSTDAQVRVGHGTRHQDAQLGARFVGFPGSLSHLPAETQVAVGLLSNLQRSGGGAPRDAFGGQLAAATLSWDRRLMNPSSLLSGAGSLAHGHVVSRGPPPPALPGGGVVTSSTAPAIPLPSISARQDPAPDTVDSETLELQEYYDSEIRASFSPGPVTCDECGRVFTQAHHLRQHEHVHLRPAKPHRCEDCGARFKKKSNFDRHRRKHTGEKSHECPLCKRRFSDASNALKHTRGHSATLRPRRIRSKSS